MDRYSWFEGIVELERYIIFCDIGFFLSLSLVSFCVDPNIAQWIRHQFEKLYITVFSLKKKNFKNVYLYCRVVCLVVLHSN